MRLALLFLGVGISAQTLPLGGIPIRPPAALTVNSQMPAGACVTSSTSPWTWSFTNTAGTVLYVFISLDGGTLPTTSVTYAGSSMTQLGNSRPSVNPGTIFLFRLTTPATGANNFVVTWNTGTQTAIGCAISFTGNAATPDSGTAVTNNYGGTTSSVLSLTTSSTTAGNIVLQGACYGDAGVTTQTGTRSSIGQINSGSFCNNEVAQYQNSVTGSTTSSFTNTVTATSWATVGIEVHSASNPSSPITSLPNTCVGDQNGTLSGSISCTWSPSAPAAGSSLVCGGTTFNGGATVTGLSISDGTTFTNSLAARDYTAGSNRWILLAYRFNIGVTAPSTVTLTITGTDQFANLVCNAFTDASGPPTADGTCTFGTTNTATTTISCTAAITTTGLDYVIGLVGAGGTFPTATAGWSTGANVKGTLTAIQIQSAAGSITPSFNVNTGQLAGINGFAIKP